MQFRVSKFEFYNSANQSIVGLSFVLWATAFLSPSIFRIFIRPAWMSISKCLSIDAEESLQNFESSLWVLGLFIRVSMILRHWGADKAWRFKENWISEGFIEISVLSLIRKKRVGGEGFDRTCSLPEQYIHFFCFRTHFSQLVWLIGILQIIWTEMDR